MAQKAYIPEGYFGYTNFQWALAMYERDMLQSVRIPSWRDECLRSAQKRLSDAVGFASA